MQDMRHIRSLDIFDGSFNSDTAELKPVIIVTVDGGLDEHSGYT